MKMIVPVAVVCMAASGCMEYRQKAFNAPPAPGIGPAAPVCPDMSQGCKKTVWAFLWGNVTRPKLEPAQCGTVGLAEVTVRTLPHTFLLSTVTLGLVSPRQVEWKCKAPTPSEGTIP